MAFGQSAGPPAHARQVAELLELLHDAGHADFRDARGPMGFTQRQAGGKFTTEEAAEFIDRLHAAAHESAPPAPQPEPPRRAAPAAELPAEPPAEPAAGAEPMSDAERALRTASTKSLVLEVRRRGWIVTKPK